MNDPNNSTDVREAYTRLLRKHTCIMTPEVEADLRAYGFEIPKMVRGRPKPGEKSFVVAGFYDLLKPKHLTDNLIGRCSCGQWIQWRPHMPADLTKLCLFCASWLD